MKDSNNADSCMSGILRIVLLSALCGLAMTECQRSKMRYNIDKIKYEKFIDSVNKQKNSQITCKYQGR